jgi:outer membrane protein
MNIRIKGVLLLGLLFVAGVASAQQKITVEDIVLLSLEQGYDVKLSRNLVSSAETDAKNSVGLFIPDLTLNGGRNWSKNDSHQTLADDSKKDVTNIKQNGLNSSAQLNWVLFDGLKMFATFKQLHQVAAVNEVLLKNQMANTMANVIGNYYNIVALEQQLRAVNEQVSVSEERIKLAERKLDVGSGIKTELLQAKLDQNAFKVQALQQEALITQAKAALNALTGGQLPEEFEVSDTIVVSYDLRKEEIIEGIEATNPQLIAARGNIEVAKYALKANKGNRFPVISFVSNYNFNRNQSNQAQNQFSPISTKTNGYQYGFTAQWTLLNNFIVKDAIQIAAITLQRQQILYEQAKVNALAAVNTAYANYDFARKTLTIEEENIKFARENVFIVLESFKRGIATFIELRTAQQSMVDAYNRLTAARYNAKVSETELLRLKGALLR